MRGKRVECVVGSVLAAWLLLGPVSAARAQQQDSGAAPAEAGEGAEVPDSGDEATAPSEGEAAPSDGSPEAAARGAAEAGAPDGEAAADGSAEGGESGEAETTQGSDEPATGKGEPDRPMVIEASGGATAAPGGGDASVHGYLGRAHDGTVDEVGFWERFGWEMVGTAAGHALAFGVLQIASALDSTEAGLNFFWGGFAWLTSLALLPPIGVMIAGEAMGAEGGSLELAVGVPFSWLLISAIGEYAWYLAFDTENYGLGKTGYIVFTAVPFVLLPAIIWEMTAGTLGQGTRVASSGARPEPRGLASLRAAPMLLPGPDGAPAGGGLQLAGRF